MNILYEGITKKNIAERTIDYAFLIVKLYRELEKDSVGRILGRQLLRCGTSIGANVHEAQGGQSKADFIAKISISHKETRETLYWLRLIQESGIASSARIVEVLEETKQLIKILSSILITSKNSSKVSNNSSLLTLRS
jgi:four helix bundle protein